MTIREILEKFEENYNIGKYNQKEGLKICCKELAEEVRKMKKISVENSKHEYIEDNRKWNECIYYIANMIEKG